jgi:hypothetical protein
MTRHLGKYLAGDQRQRAGAWLSGVIIPISGGLGTIE